jgi:hypothetical protein
MIRTDTLWETFADREIDSATCDIAGAVALRDNACAVPALLNNSEIPVIGTVHGWVV